MSIGTPVTSDKKVANLPTTLAGKSSVSYATSILMKTAAVAVVILVSAIAVYFLDRHFRVLSITGSFIVAHPLIAAGVLLTVVVAGTLLVVYRMRNQAKPGANSAADLSANPSPSQAPSSSGANTTNSSSGSAKTSTQSGSQSTSASSQSSRATTTSTANSSSSRSSSSAMTTSGQTNIGMQSNTSSSSSRTSAAAQSVLAIPTSSGSSTGLSGQSVNATQIVNSQTQQQDEPLTYKSPMIPTGNLRVMRPEKRTEPGFLRDFGAGFLFGATYGVVNLTGKEMDLGKRERLLEKIKNRIFRSTLDEAKRCAEATRLYYSVESHYPSTELLGTFDVLATEATLDYSNYNPYKRSDGLPHQKFWVHYSLIPYPGFAMAEILQGSEIVKTLDRPRYLDYVSKVFRNVLAAQAHSGATDVVWGQIGNRYTVYLNIADPSYTALEAIYPIETEIMARLMDAFAESSLHIHYGLWTDKPDTVDTREYNIVVSELLRRPDLQNKVTIHLDYNLLRLTQDLADQGRRVSLHSVVNGGLFNGQWLKDGEIVPRAKFDSFMGQSITLAITSHWLDGRVTDPKPRSAGELRRNVEILEGNSISFEREIFNHQQ